MRRGIVALSIFLSACGGASSSSGLAHTLLPAPPDRAPRAQALDAFGRALFAAMKSGDFTTSRVAADDTELGTLLDPVGASTAMRLRPATRDADPWNRAANQLALRNAQYAGVCLQGGREEAAGTPPFLPRAAGWVVERVLVVADDVRAGRMAGWVEGTFVLTDRGFVAIVIDRIEAPRQHHADLEMGACDMEVGLDDHNM